MREGQRLGNRDGIWPTSLLPIAGICPRHERVADGFLAMAAEEPKRFRVVELAGIEETAERVWDAVKDLF